MQRLVVLLAALLLIVSGAVAVSAQGGDSNRAPITIGNVNQLAELKVVRGPEVSSVALSPDGTIIAEGMALGTVRLVDAASGSVLRTFEVGLDEVWQVQFTPDGTKLFASGAIGRLWDVASGQELHSFDGFSQIVADGGLVVVTHFDSNTTELWDVAAGAPLSSLAGDEMDVTPDGKFLAIQDSQGGVSIVAIPSTEEVYHLQIDTSTFPTIILNSDATQLFVHNYNDGSFTMHLWDVASGKEVFSPSLPTGEVWSIFSADGKLFAVFETSGPLHVYDAATFEELYSLEADSASFSPDSSMLIVVEGGSVQFLNAMSGETVHSLSVDSDVKSAFFNSDRSLLMLWHESGALETWGILREGEVIEISTPEPAVPGSGPRPGHWEGNDGAVVFDVTASGEIVNLGISIPFAGAATCNVTIPVTGESVSADGQFQIDISTSEGTDIFIGGFLGVFDSSTHMTGTYTVKMCGDTVSFVDSDTPLEAAWVSD